MKTKYLYNLICRNRLYADYLSIIGQLDAFSDQDLEYFYNYYSNRSAAHKLFIDCFFKYLINDQELPEEVRNYILMVMVTR